VARFFGTAQDSSRKEEAHIRRDLVPAPLSPTPCHSASLGFGRWLMEYEHGPRKCVPIPSQTSPWELSSRSPLRRRGGRWGMNALLQITAQLQSHFFTWNCHPDEVRGRIWPQPRVCAKFTAGLSQPRVAPILNLEHPIFIRRKASGRKEGSDHNRGEAAAPTNSPHGLPKCAVSRGIPARSPRNFPTGRSIISQRLLQKK